MGKIRDFNKLVAQYRLETGKTEIDHLEVSKWVLTRGYVRPPRPPDPVKVLAKQIARCQRQETRTDPETGRPYRANHAIRRGSRSVWIDIDRTENRRLILESLGQRRQQIAYDAIQLARDAEHWNKAHAEQEPIQLEFDFTFDVELSKYDEGDAAA